MQETAVRFSIFKALVFSPGTRGKETSTLSHPPDPFQPAVLLTRVFLDSRPGVLGMACKCLQGIQRWKKEDQYGVR